MATQDWHKTNCTPVNLEIYNYLLCIRKCHLLSCHSCLQPFMQ